MDDIEVIKDKSFKRLKELIELLAGEHQGQIQTEKQKRAALMYLSILEETSNYEEWLRVNCVHALKLNLNTY